MLLGDTEMGRPRLEAALDRNVTASHVVMILRLESASLHTSVDVDLQALETRLSILPIPELWGSPPLDQP